MLTHAQNPNGNMVSWWCMPTNYWFERALCPRGDHVGNKQYRHLTDIWSHYYWVNTPRYITQNSLSNNISTKMYFKSKTKQYLLWCFNMVLWLMLRYAYVFCQNTMDGNICNSGTKYLSGECTSHDTRWTCVDLHVYGRIWNLSPHKPVSPLPRIDAIDPNQLGVKSYFVSFIGGEILYVQYLLTISLQIDYDTFHICKYTPIIVKCGLVVVPSYYLIKYYAMSLWLGGLDWNIWERKNNGRVKNYAHEDHKLMIFFGALIRKHRLVTALNEKYIQDWYWLYYVYPSGCYIEIDRMFDMHA